MNIYIRIFIPCVFKNTKVCKDDGIAIEFDRIVHRSIPLMIGIHLRKCVYSKIDLLPLYMGVINALSQFIKGKVESFKIAGISGIVKARINHISAVINSRL